MSFKGDMEASIIEENMKRLREEGTSEVAEVEEAENEVYDKEFIAKFWREVVKILAIDVFC